MIKNENIKALVKKFNEEKLAHIFLIETNDKTALLADILEFCKVLSCPQTYSEGCSSCNLCHLIDIDALPSLKVIYPDGQAIKKEQMEELKNTFSKMPYLSQYNCYIINDVEKFNSSSDKWLYVCSSTSSCILSFCSIPLFLFIISLVSIGITGVCEVSI